MSNTVSHVIDAIELEPVEHSQVDYTDYDYNFFPTPYELALAAMTKLLPEIYTPRSIWDIAAGKGVWGRAARAVFGRDPFIAGLELDTQHEADKAFNYFDYCDLLRHDQVLTAGSHGYIRTLGSGQAVRIPRPDLIVSNPPFSGGRVEAFIRRANELVNPDHGVVMMLMRLGLLEGQGRGGDLWKSHVPWKVWTLVQRPVFVGVNSDSKTPYGVFIWSKTHTGRTFEGDWLSWRESKSRRRK